MNALSIVYKEASSGMGGQGERIPLQPIIHIISGCKVQLIAQPDGESMGMTNEAGKSNKLVPMTPGLALQENPG